jgi:hypothetical protein
MWDVFPSISTAKQSGAINLIMQLPPVVSWCSGQRHLGIADQGGRQCRPSDDEQGPKRRLAGLFGPNGQKSLGQGDRFGADLAFR